MVWFRSSTITIRRTAQALEALITSSAAAKLPYQPPPLTDAKTETHASRPVGNPQYPITCNKHSLISSSFKPLLKPILTCAFSCEMLPLAARILFRQFLCFRDARKETNEITVKLLYFFSKPSLSQILAKHDPIKYSYAGFLNSD
jgi:hypothetical protein